MDTGLGLAVVTGGGSGIGAAAARALAARGHAVLALDLQAHGADTVPAAGQVCAWRVDVADAADVVRVFDRIGALAGHLQVLVNSAGVESRVALGAFDTAAWDRVQAVNVRGTMLCTQAAAALMRRGAGGAIVNVASIAGKRMSYSGDAAYTASKAAVLGFTRHAAFELAAHRIRVNAVCPGPTLTPMITRSLDAARIRAVEASVPLGRWVQPEDVAAAIVFLAGDAAAMCTGTTLDVDGGVLIANAQRPFVPAAPHQTLPS